MASQVQVMVTESAPPWHRNSVKRPTWAQVKDAVLSLNQADPYVVTLFLDSRESRGLTIEGGGGAYHVVYFVVDDSVQYLIAPDDLRVKPTSPNPTRPDLYPINGNLIPLAQVFSGPNGPLQVARVFWESGALDTTHRWLADPTNGSRP